MFGILEVPFTEEVTMTIVQIKRSKIVDAFPIVLNLNQFGNFIGHLRAIKTLLLKIIIFDWRLNDFQQVQTQTHAIYDIKINLRF